LRKVVAGKTQHNQASFFVFGVQRFKPFVLGCETTKASRVDHDDDLASVLAQVLWFFVLQARHGVLQDAWTVGCAGRGGLGRAMCSTHAGKPTNPDEKKTKNHNMALL
jgi:hypothetical protein